MSCILIVDKGITGKGPAPIALLSIYRCDSQELRDASERERDRENGVERRLQEEGLQETYTADDESVYERYLSFPDDFDVQEAKYQEELKAEILAASDEYWRAQFDLDVDQLRKVCDPKAPFVHMGITMDRGAEEEAIAQRRIVTVRRDDKHVDVRVIDDEIAIVLRQLELTALVGGDEAVNPFVATETYHRTPDGGWKLVSFVYTHIMPENYQFRFLSE